MKTYTFNAKNHSATIILNAENVLDAIDELEEILKQDDVNDYRLDEESEDDDGHEELPHGNEHWNDEKAKRPTPEDCMHISKDLKAQLDEVSKNRYFTPDENTKKI
jgi:hypothetical protein